MSKAKKFTESLPALNEDFKGMAGSMDTMVVSPMQKVLDGMDAKDPSYKKVEAVKMAAAKVMGDLLKLK